MKGKHSKNNNDETISNVLWLIADLLSVYKNQSNPLMDVSQRNEDERKDNGISLEFRI